MANPELGQKQVCPNCQAKFYDLGRRPAHCPKCATDFDPEEALKLRNRRPDLWDIPLTCENATTLVPTLDIVCEVLEDYVAKDITPRPSGRPAIRNAVYAKLATTDVDAT